MVRVRVFVGKQITTGGEELLGASGIRWIDVLEANEPLMKRLGEQFGLHRLAIEDALHLDQRPKLEEYPGHQFIVLQGFSPEGATGTDVVMHEMHFFLGEDWLITVHERSHEAIEAVHKRVDADPAGTMGRGPDFVAYLVADEMVDLHFPLLDRFSDALEEIEERIFTDASQALMHRAFGLKRSLGLVRRVLSPQRDVVGMLARSGVKHVQDRTTLYFRDVFDHLVRIYEQIDAARDLTGNVMDVYLSVIANRTGEVTKQLTIFASIFMPLSFVVGFFGQNFEALSRPYFLAAMVVLLVAVPSSMLVWFRHRRWL